ncbi:MAG: hypothetical protein ACO1OC_13790, partial [Tuberibacillus sp.]
RSSSEAAARTRKLSSRADGNWGLPPVRVGRRRAKAKEQQPLFFFLIGRTLIIPKGRFFVFFKRIRKGICEFGTLYLRVFLSAAYSRCIG